MVDSGDDDIKTETSDAAICVGYKDGEYILKVDMGAGERKISKLQAGAMPISQ